MFVYFLILLWVFICAILSLDLRISKLQQKRIILLLISIPLILLAGIRDGIGVDFDTYLQHYEEVTNLFSFERTFQSMEVGYEYLVSVFKTFHLPFFFVTLFIALITFELFNHLSLRYSTFPSLSLLMFFSLTFWGQVMGQMRQPLAILSLYFFLFLLKKGKNCILLLFLITILVGLLFHKSVIFFLLPLLFLTRQLKVHQYGVILVLSIIVGHRLVSLMPLIINYIPDFFTFKDAAIAYLTYKSEGVTFTLGMIERITMFLIVTYYCAKYQILEKDKLMLIFYNMYFYGICLYFLLIPFSDVLASRGTFVLTWSLFFLFPNTLKYISKKQDFIIVFIVIILWSLYLSTKVFFRDDNIYIPYKSIFS
ncbi:EpsG family protein [Parabacteroides goldsteinii]|jgi:hypothetical protein|uniref:EpsG family protein n=1 Tax=Parabacteroides goldsteinii TaxID=328812 RepID=UPI002671F6B7|nr:EpsG family protein [Parabacteroides goldsteinii]